MANGKTPGEDFEDLMREARKNPEVANYLDSFSAGVGDIVLSRRLNLNLSQLELANKSGTSYLIISRIEAGFGDVKLSCVNKVFAALEITSNFWR